MTRKALLVDYEYCTGCHSCEVACRNEHNLPLDQYGIKLAQVGPFKVEEGKWIWNYTPMVTELCDLCADRVTEGGQPTCVQHCLASVISYGTLAELAEQMDVKGRQMYLMLP